MIGRVVVKLSGKESGRTAVIVDNVDDNFVIIDGNLKRRKCNLSHLELTNAVLDIKKGASTKEVHDAMKKSSFKVTLPREKKAKEIKEKANGKRKK